MYVTVVGIANSVELFQGEIFSAQDQLRSRSSKKVFICPNEQKLLFKPYTRDEISAILTGLAQDTLQPYHKKVEELIDPKAFQLAASKIDKLSGDIRVCFEIMRQSVTKALTDKVSYIGYEDTLKVVTEMFDSKVTKIVQKLPRSHIIMLTVILEIVSDRGQLHEMTTAELLKDYNYQAN